MSIDLGRRLVAVGLVSSQEVEAALFISLARAVPLARILLDRGAISEKALEDELERAGGLGIRRVVGATELFARLPRAMCRRLAAVPTRLDTESNTVDIVVADPLDPHIPAEFGFHLGCAIRVFRAPIAAVEDAIRRLELEEAAPEAPAPPPAEVRPRRVTPPFPHGAPQSTVPPPPTDDPPIPLVRRIPPMPSIPGEAEALVQPPSSGVDSIVLPLRNVKPVQADEIPVPLQRSKPTPAGAAGGGHPSISFPSDLPPDHDDPAEGLRIAPPGTSPYGIPAVKVPPPPPPSAPRVTREWSPTEVAEAMAGVEALAAARAELPAAARAERKPTIRGMAMMPPRPLPQDLDDAGPKPTIKGIPLVAPLPMLDWGGDEAPAPAPRATPEEKPNDATARGSRPPLFVPDALPEGGMHQAIDPGPVEPPPKRLLRAPDGTSVLEALQQTPSRDEVVKLALRGLRLVARRIAVFAVRRDGFYGWACNVDFGDPEALRDLVVPQDLPSVLATAAAAGVYLGPIPHTLAHDGLLRVMDRASSDVAAISVRVGGRAAMILMADDLEDTLIGTRWMGELAHAIGETLSRVLAVKG